MVLFVCLFFSQKWLLAGLVWDVLGVEFYLFIGVRRGGEGRLPRPKYINLFIFTVGINCYIWQWVWMFIHKKILLFVSVSLFEACLCNSCALMAILLNTAQANCTGNFQLRRSPQLVQFEEKVT